MAVEPIPSDETWWKSSFWIILYLQRLQLQVTIISFCLTTQYKSGALVLVIEHKKREIADAATNSICEREQTFSAAVTSYHTVHRLYPK
jgi:hypothetical protein